MQRAASVAWVFSLPTQDEINESIAESAVGPLSVTEDGNTVLDRTADDKIKLAKWTAAQAAVENSPSFGMVMTQLVPGGCG